MVLLLQSAAPTLSLSQVSLKNSSTTMFLPLSLLPPRHSSNPSLFPSFLPDSPNPPATASAARLNIVTPLWAPPVQPHVCSDAGVVHKPSGPRRMCHNTCTASHTCGAVVGGGVVRPDAAKWRMREGLMDERMDARMDGWCWCSSTMQGSRIC